MTSCTMRIGAAGPAMLRPDAEPLPIVRPSRATLDARDRAFGVTPPKGPPLMPPDPTQPLPPRCFLAPRVGYAFALPPLEFKIVGAVYRASADTRRRASFDTIVAAIEAAFGVDRLALLSRRRHKPTAEARIAAYCLLREFTPWSMPEIARALKRVDHTTVLSGHRRAEFLIESGSPFAARLAQARGIVETRIAAAAAGETP